jgi:uncharacterized phage infection (PIP) family protein YhgE
MRIGTLLTRSSGLLACVILVTNGATLYRDTRESPPITTAITPQKSVKPIQVGKAPTKVIALVNEDTGGEFNKKHYTLGDAFLQDLVSLADYEWYPTTRSVANAAIRSGDIDAMLIVNQDFTEKILNLNTQSPTQAKVDSVIDTSLPDVTQAQLETHFQEYLSRFNQSASRMYLSTIMASFQDSKWLVDDQLAQLTAVNRTLIEDSNSGLQEAPENFKKLSTLISDLEQVNDQDKQDYMAQVEAFQKSADVLIQKRVNEIDTLPNELTALAEQHEALLGQLASQYEQVMSEKDSQYQAIANQLQEAITTIDNAYHTVASELGHYEAAVNSFVNQLSTFLQDTSDTINDLSERVELLDKQAKQLMSVTEQFDTKILNTSQFYETISTYVSNLPVNLPELLELALDQGHLTVSQVEDLSLYVSAIEALQLPMGPEFSIDEPESEENIDEIEAVTETETASDSVIDNQSGQLEISSGQVVEMTEPTPTVDWWEISSQVIECVSLMRDYYGVPSISLEEFATEFSTNPENIDGSLKAIGQQTIGDQFGQEKLAVISEINTSIETLIPTGQEIRHRLNLTSDLLSQAPSVNLDNCNYPVATGFDNVMIETSTLNLNSLSETYSEATQALQDAIRNYNQTLMGEWKTLTSQKSPEAVKESKVSIQDATELIKQAELSLDTLNDKVDSVAEQLSVQHDNLELYQKNFSDQLNYSQDGGQDNLDYLNFLARPIQLSFTQTRSDQDATVTDRVSSSSDDVSADKTQSINRKALILTVLSTVYLLALLVRKLFHHHEKL